MPGIADAVGSGRVRVDAIARWLQDVAYADIIDAGFDEGGAWVVRRIDGVPVGSVLAPLVRPLAACVPMAAAAIGIRWALGVVHAPAAVSLVAEIAGGAIAYVGSAFLIANAASKEMIDLLRRALKRRRRGESDEDSPESE